jgi:hypothetical protein
MDIYRVPRREVPVRILLDDGRTLEGALFTSATGRGGVPEDVLCHLNESAEEFLPLACGADVFLLNKAGVIWVQLTGDGAEEIADKATAARRAPARISLSGGVNLVGTLPIVMPRERSRVLDYLNAADRFFPLMGGGSVTLVQRRFVVTVRSGHDAEE